MKNNLDVRDLPPPEPMIRILEAVTFLSPGGTLQVVLNRIPHPLYPRLQERGLMVETEQRNEDEVYLFIRRPA
ncbi:MAG: DUF2249 domain-containing protein [Magnetococcus sp. YQC-9]